jgi:methylmalonyl-CoA/ethylmalonyl-CoA epimerase
MKMIETKKKLKYPKYIEHIGIAVRSLDESIPIFEKILGTKCYSTETVDDQFVKTAFFRIGDTKVELLEPTESVSPISAFLQKNGQGVHHIAFAVDDTDDALQNAKSNGFRLIDQQAHRGAEGMDIGFLNPKKTSGVLVEFCSDPTISDG